MCLLFKILLCFLVPLSVFAKKDNPPITFLNAEILNENTTRIPFKIIDHLIIVEAQLLDKRGNFIIDTGSETLILNSKHFKTYNTNGANGKNTNGVNSKIDNVKEKFIKSLSIKDLNLNKLNADVINLSHFEKIKKISLLGIIGYNILKDFEVFIDMYLNQITLTKTDKLGNRLQKKVYAEKFQDSINFKLKKHTIVLNGYVGNYKVRFGLDTAAEYNQINKSLNKKILSYFYKSKKLKLTGASGKSKKVTLGRLFSFKLNDKIYFGPMYTVLTNFNQMQDTFGTHLDGILGYEFFKQKRTIINYKKQKLYFIKNPIIYN